MSFRNVFLLYYDFYFNLKFILTLIYDFINFLALRIFTKLHILTSMK